MEQAVVGRGSLPALHHQLEALALQRLVVRLGAELEHDVAGEEAVVLAGDRGEQRGHLRLRAGVVAGGVGGVGDRLVDRLEVTRQRRFLRLLLVAVALGERGFGQRDGRDRRARDHGEGERER